MLWKTQSMGGLHTPVLRSGRLPRTTVGMATGCLERGREHVCRPGGLERNQVAIVSDKEGEERRN